MGIEVFAYAMAFVLAGGVTWLILWFFFPSGHPAAEMERLGDHPVDAADAGKKPEAETAGTQDQERARELTWLVSISAVLTAPGLLAFVLRTLTPGLLPAWVFNPWLQAIIITPVMFYCGRPIHRSGLPAITNRHPNMNSLVSVGTWAAYTYSLLVCVMPWAFPEGSREPYFDAVGVIITLVLLGELMQALAAAGSTSASTSASSRRPSTGIAASDDGRARSADLIAAMKARAQRTPGMMLHMADSISRILVPTVLIIATWTFAAWMVLGPEPQLAHAFTTAFNVLIIACPCAMSLVTPLSMGEALDLGESHGVLVASGRALEQARAIHTVAFDATALHGIHGIEAASATACSALRARGVTTELIVDTDGDDAHAEALARTFDVDGIVNAAPSDEHGVTAVVSTWPMAAERKPSALRIALGLPDSIDSGFAADGEATADKSIPDITLTGGPRGVLSAMRLSDAAMRNFRQNMIWTLAYNVIGLPLAVGVLYPFTGWLLSPMVAGLAMAASTICLVLNAHRLRRHRL